MTRYFYTDPLSAAWMSRHFGMQLLAGSGDIWEDWMPMEDAMSRGGGTYSPYYIHPDSLHLLEVKQGDVIESQHGIPLLIGEEDDGEQISIDSAVSLTRRIIQRDGKPFMWPEAE